MVRLKELERWLSTADVAAVLGWSRQGVVNLASQGRVRAVKTRIGWLYDPESVEAFRAAAAEDPTTTRRRPAGGSSRRR